MNTATLPRNQFWPELLATSEFDLKPFNIHIDKSFHAIFKKIDWHPEKYRIICLTFLHCAFSNVSSNRMHEKYGVTLVTFVWLFSIECFQMSPQIACMRKCTVTLVAFICLFAIVRFQMYGIFVGLFFHCALSNVSSNCLHEKYIVTLVTFVWLFSIECFQMSPQIACMRKCTVTLVAFVCLCSPLCVFKCILRTPAQKDANSQWKIFQKQWFIKSAQY